MTGRWLSSPMWTQLEGDDFNASALAFNRRGTLAAAGSVGGGCKIWDTTSLMVCVREFTGADPAEGGVTGLAFSCDSRLLAVASPFRVQIWDITSSTVKRRFR